MKASDLQDHVAVNIEENIEIIEFHIQKMDKLLKSVDKARDNK